MPVDACAALPGRTAHLLVELIRHLTQAVVVAVDEGDQAAALSGAAHELAVGNRQRRFQHFEAGDDVRVDLLNLSMDHVGDHAGRLEGLFYQIGLALTVLVCAQCMRLLACARPSLAQYLHKDHRPSK